MNNVQERIRNLQTKLRETMALEAPGLAFESLGAIVCLPYPVSHADLVFFYGAGVVSHENFEYATTRLSESLQADGWETRFAQVTQGGYEMFLEERKLSDLPERRICYLGLACGHAEPPENVVSAPLFAPAVISFGAPGRERAQLVVL
jgi:hypothetical protein